MNKQPDSDIEVLLIEDNATFADIVLTSLKIIGIRPHHVEDGEEALEYLKNRKPDLILLDLNLPGMNGWQVLKYAKEQHGSTGMSVIVTSAYSDAANRTIGRLQLVSRYLVKPFTPKELYAAVDEVLKRYKMGNQEPSTGSALA